MTEQNQIRQTENQSAEPQVHTVGARWGAEREERTNSKPMISWAALLDEAVSKPGFIHHATAASGTTPWAINFWHCFSVSREESRPALLPHSGSGSNWEGASRRAKRR